MVFVEIAIVAGILWAIMLFVGFVQNPELDSIEDNKKNAGLISSFLPMALIHLILFCIFYGTTGYLIVQMSPLFKFEILIFWVLGGVLCGVFIVEAIRVRTDRQYILRRWILKDIEESDNPEVHLDILVRKIRNDYEEEFAKDILIVLKGRASRGDSLSGLIRTTLEKYDIAN